MEQWHRERNAWGRLRGAGRPPCKQKGCFHCGESEEGRLTAGMSGQPLSAKRKASDVFFGSTREF